MHSVHWVLGAHQNSHVDRRLAVVHAVARIEAVVFTRQVDEVGRGLAVVTFPVAERRREECLAEAVEKNLGFLAEAVATVVVSLHTIEVHDVAVVLIASVVTHP